MVNETVSRAFVVSEDDIAERAYAIYVDRGKGDGFDREDWIRAERELTTPRAIAADVSRRRSKRR